MSAKDFIVNILGEDKTAKAWESFKANAGKAAAGAAAAFAGKELGEALLGNIDNAAITDRLDAALGASAAQSQAWGAAAAGAYRGAWGESMEEAAAGVEAVVGSIGGMRDAAEEDIQAATEKALALSQAMSIDVGQSATTAGILIKNGLAADATAAFDLMTAGLQKIPAEMRGEALDALNEYSVNFAQLGLSGDKAMSMLVSASANGGIAIDKTGDSLKEFTIRATDMSASSVAAYDALGLNAQQMSNEILAGGDRASTAFSTIVSGLQGITDPATQANTAIALFGTPIEDLGTGQIPAFLDALGGAQAGLGDTAGAADKMAETLSGNPKARVEELRRGFEGWKQDLVGMPGPLGDVAVGVQAFGGDAAQLATSVGLGVVALQNMKLAAIASKVATVAGTVATGAATAAQWLFNAALNANPIGLIILAVSALVAGLVWFFTQTEAGQAIVQAVWGGIKTAVSAVTDWWTNTAQPALAAGWEAIKIVFNQGVEFVKGVLSAGWEILKGIFAWSPLGLIIGNWDAIKGAFSAGIEGVKSFLSAGWEVLKKIFAWSPVGIIVSNWDAIVGFFKSVPGKIGSALSGVGNALKNAFRGPFNSIAGFWNRSVGSLRFTVPDWVPGVGGKGWGFPKIPMLATGAVVTSATLAMIGEGNEPEAVLPLSRLDAMLNDARRGTGASNDEPAAGGPRVVMHITNNYPQAEPTSTTTNRALAYAAAVGEV